MYSNGCYMNSEKKLNGHCVGRSFTLQVAVVGSKLESKKGLVIVTLSLYDMAL